MNVSFDELSFENIGKWPFSLKLRAAGLALVMLLILGYWLFIRHQVYQLKQAQQAELQLRSELATKQPLVTNFAAYQRQLQSIGEHLDKMLYQLPVETGVPALLEAILETGVESGLTFELFKSLPEVEKDFYAELPIEIRIKGRYHQLAEFISRIASLDHIVTIHDVHIERVRASQSQQAALTDELSIFLMVKIYRYVYEKEEQI